MAFSITLSLPPPMRPGSGCLSPVPSDMQYGGGVDGVLGRLKMTRDERREERGERREQRKESREKRAEKREQRAERREKREG